MTSRDTTRAAVRKGLKFRRVVAGRYVGRYDGRVFILFRGRPDSYSSVEWCAKEVPFESSAFGRVLASDATLRGVKGRLIDRLTRA